MNVFLSQPDIKIYGGINRSPLTSAEKKTFSEAKNDLLYPFEENWTTNTLNLTFNFNVGYKPSKCWFIVFAKIKILESQPHELDNYINSNEKYIK